METSISKINLAQEKSLGDADTTKFVVDTSVVREAEATEIRAITMGMEAEVISGTMLVELDLG